MLNNIHPYTYVGLSLSESPERFIDRIIQLIGVSKKGIMSGRRHRELSDARFIIVSILSKKYPHMSTSKIGQLIGGRDHSTVIHARNKVINLLAVDKNFKKTHEEIEKLLDN